MDPAKRSKHIAGFKIKVIQFAKENRNCVAARMFDVSESSIPPCTPGDDDGKRFRVWINYILGFVGFEILTSGKKKVV
ncbi:hypothetical protein CDAR_72551 [Caerostris darwini]|uniref:Mos1 transposase HTH domain-containing protein n=1 Tax=Caerostris darwini TaxID=1538125 RepID=A0AAV4MN19_9ARAC|nr:hypothetical protein CDAR_72551 [Caerostris darwini]